MNKTLVAYFFDWNFWINSLIHTHLKGGPKTFDSLVRFVVDGCDRLGLKRPEGASNVRSSVEHLLRIGCIEIVTTGPVTVNLTAKGEEHEAPALLVKWLAKGAR